MHVIAAPDFSVTLSWLAQENGRVTHAAFSSVRGVVLSIAVSLPQVPISLGHKTD